MSSCVVAKLTRSSYQLVQWESEPLDLIHSDVCDLKFVQTREGFSTFVVDSMKNIVVYLLKKKDGA